MAFPASFDAFSAKSAGDTISETHVNVLQTPVVSLEEKLGIGTPSTASTNTALLGTGASSTGYQVISLANIALVSGNLPISRGGTGTNSNAYCNLTTNVVGTLPVANGGTNAILFQRGNAINSSAGNTTIVFASPFADTTYTAIVSLLGTATANAYWEIQSKAVGSMVVYTNCATGFWEYIVVGN